MLAGAVAGQRPGEGDPVLAPGPFHVHQRGVAAVHQVLADQSFERVSHAEILAILERHRSVDYALATAYRYADLARALVADLPESDERRALLWMPDFVVARDK